jgi:hypothetical protein
MRTRERVGSREDEWERVWAEHDARQRVVPPVETVAEPLPVRPDPSLVAPRRAGGRWTFAALLLLLPLLWVAEPVVTAWQVARALETGDVRTLARHFDAQAVEAEIRERLAEVVGRSPEGASSNFLNAMAEDIARAWANPAAVAAAATRGGIPPRLHSIGLTEFEIAVGTEAAPMTLRLELSEGAIVPRWQVTGVRSAAQVPQHAPAGPTRLSQR